MPSLHTITENVNPWATFRERFEMIEGRGIPRSDIRLLADQIYDSRKTSTILDISQFVGNRLAHIQVHVCGDGHTVVMSFLYSSQETYWIDADNVVWGVNSNGLQSRDQELPVVAIIRKLAYGGWKDEDVN